MKKIGMLFIIYVLLLAGCEVAEKMVIQYEDYQETVLSERFESELGFSMQVVHGMEVREDIEEKRVEFLEPYSLKISLRDDVEHISNLYDELWLNNTYNSPSSFMVIGIYDPSSIRLPKFDMVLMFEVKDEAHIYVYKEGADGVIFCFEMIIPFEEVELSFPIYRAMLASIDISGLEKEEIVKEEELFSSFPPYRGDFDNIQIQYFKYYEEEKLKSKYAELSHYIGDPEYIYEHQIEEYQQLLRVHTDYQDPTGEWFTQLDKNISKIGKLYESSRISRRPNDAAYFSFYNVPAGISFRYTFAEILDDFEDIIILDQQEVTIKDSSYIIDDQEIIIGDWEANLTMQFLDKEDVYYFIVIEVIGEIGVVEDTLEHIIHIPLQELHVQMGIEKETYLTGEDINLHYHNSSALDIYGYKDPYLEKWIEDEWWKIPFDGFVVPNGGGIYLSAGEVLNIDNMTTKGLSPGKYRIVQELILLGEELEEFALAVQLEIMEEDHE